MVRAIDVRIGGLSEVLVVQKSTKSIGVARAVVKRV